MRAQWSSKSGGSQPRLRKRGWAVKPARAARTNINDAHGVLRRMGEVTFRLSVYVISNSSGPVRSMLRTAA